MLVSKIFKNLAINSNNLFVTTSKLIMIGLLFTFVIVGFDKSAGSLIGDFLTNGYLNDVFGQSTSELIYRVLLNGIVFFGLVFQLLMIFVSPVPEERTIGTNSYGLRSQLVSLNKWQYSVAIGIMVAQVVMSLLWK